MTINLTVLGTATPHPVPGNPCSGYLLQVPGTAVWVDAGPGTFAELQRHCQPQELAAVWLSHLHADHWVDLAIAYYAFAFGGMKLRAPLRVYAPTDAARRLCGFFARSDAGFLEPYFDIRPIEEGTAHDLGGLTIVARAVSHDVPAFAVRAEADGASVVYTGDSAPCAALTELAAGADLLLCEAGSDGRAKGPPCHHTPAEAGALAAAAGVGRLVVTHVAPSLDPHEAALVAAAAHGNATAAARGQTYAV